MGAWCCFAGAGIAEGARAVIDFGRESVNAAVKTEGYMRSLTALYGSANQGAQAFADLNELASLPGITLEGAVQGAIRIKTVNVEGERANAIIREFGNSAAVAGATSEEMGRALVVLTQTLSRGQIEQDNLNQILENVPIIGTAIQEAFGSIDAENIRNQLDAAGQDVNDFVDILTNQLSKGARASADSTANAFSNLGNATFKLQSAIGDQLTPVITAVTRGLTDLFEGTAELLSRVSNADEVLSGVTAGVREFDTALSNTASIEAQNTAIENYISVLENAQGQLQMIVDFNQGGGFNAITGTATDLSEEIAQIGLYGEEIEHFQGILQGSAISIDFFEGKVTDLSESIQRQQAIISDATREQTELAAAGESGSRRYADLNQQIIEAHQTTEALTSELNRYNAIVKIGEQNLNDAAIASDLFTSSEETATEATQNFGLELAKLEAVAQDTATRLQNTESFDQLSENYRNAIQASDAYYNALIAGAERALAAEEAGSEEAQQIETELFELRRERAQAREKLTSDAAEHGAAEAKRRVDAQAAEEERLLAIEEESFRARRAQQEEDRAEAERIAKEKTQAAERLQKEQTEVAEEEIKAREEAQTAANERVTQNSSEQLEIIKRQFENVLPEAVESSYQNIQAQTIAHYELLKNQARERITDEDELNSELLSLDRQRNAELGDNHRTYLQRLVNDAKTQLGERTEAFQEASGNILHNWDLTVSEFERRLRDADTEDALNEIEVEFDEAQQEMLESLQTVLTELGFTAEQSAAIMTSFFQTAETESTGFADKVLRIFARLGEESERETEQQNREIEKAYQELVNNIQKTLGAIGNIFGQLDGDAARFFEQLANTSTDLVRIATGDFTAIANIAGDVINFISNKEEELHERRRERARERLEFEEEAAERIAELADIESIFGNQISPFITPPESRFSPGQRGGELEELGLVAPLVFGSFPAIDLQGLVDSAPDISDVLSGLIEQQLTAAIGTAVINGESIEDAYSPFIDRLGMAMERAGDNLQTAIEREASPETLTDVFNDYLSSINDFFNLQIESVRAQERATGAFFTDTIRSIEASRANTLNAARRAEASDRPNFQAISRQQGNRARRSSAAADAPVSDLYAQYQADVDAATATATATVDGLRTRTASRLANDAINAIGEAANDINVAEQTILELWEQAIPSIEAWWQSLHDDIVNDPNLSDAEQSESLAELGNIETFVSNIKSQYVTPVIQNIRQGIEALETRTATRLANDAIGAIGEAASDVNVSEQTILELWEQAVPTLENWWNELYQDIVNNPNLTSAEQTEALAELGTQETFVNSLKSQSVTPVIQGIQQGIEALETRTATRLANDAINAIGEAAGDVNVTESTILELWQQAIPSIEAWYNELRDDIVNDPNLSNAEMTEALAELGSVETFVGNIKSQSVTPVIQGIQQATEALQTRTATRLANDAINAIGEAAGDVNVTEQTILELWEQAVPSIEAWYNELRDDIVNDPNLSDAEQSEALAELGSVETFVGNIKSQSVTPVIQGIQQATEALQTRTATRLANDAINAIGEAAGDVNVTEQTILELWEQAVPSIEAWYNELRDDIVNDPNLSDAEQSEALAGLGSIEDFVDDIKSQSVTPVIQGIQQGLEALETRTASREANDAINAIGEAAADVNVTESTILELWEQAVPSIEAWYNELRDDIVNDPNLSDAQMAEALAELGSVADFVSNIKSQYVEPTLQGIQQGIEALETRTTSREANNAIGAIGEAASDVNVTEQTILELWEQAVPRIEAWWQELHDDIVNDPNLSDAEQSESLAELGSVEDFVSNIKSQSVTPTLQGIRQGIEALETRTETRLANDAINAISEAAGDVNVTEQTILELWEQAVPSIEAWWQELYDDIVNDPNLSAAEQGEALAELGNVADFVGNIKSQSVTPVIQGIRQGLETLETQTATRVANDAIEAFSEAVSDIDLTAEALLELWEQTAPTLENWWQELYDDIVNDPNLSDAEQSEALAGLGSVEDFVDDLKSQYVEPILERIENTENQIADFDADNQFNEDVEAFKTAINDVNNTIDDVNTFMMNFIENVLRPRFEFLRSQILDDDGIISAAEELALRQGGVFDFDDFAAPFIQIGDTATENTQTRGRQTRSSAGRNNVNRARFNLGNAESEEGFEDLRTQLVTAINEFYNSEVERLQGLGLATDELAVQLGALELNRERDIQNASELENSFTTERIANEEAVAEAAQNASEARAAATQRRIDAEAEIARDLSRELAEIDTNLARERRDIQTELGRDIRDAEIELSRELQQINTGLARELAEIDTNLAREQRDIQTELARERRDIQTELGRDIRDIEIELQREIEQINLDLARELEQIQRDLATELTDIQTNLAREQRDIQTNLAREQRDIQTELGRDLRDIETELGRDLRDIETELNRDIEQINVELSRNLRDIQTDLAREISEIQTNLARERRDIQTELGRDIRDAEIELSRELQQINLDLARELEQINTTLAAELTEIQTEASRERRDIQTELGRDIRDAEIELQREIEDINKDLARELEQIQVDLMRSEVQIREDTVRELRDIDAEYAREQEEAARELSRDLEDIERDRLQSIEEANREHQQNLVDISRGATEDIEDINIDLSRRLADIDSRLQRQLANLTGTRRERGERAIELRLRAAQDRQDARLRASRDIEDVERERQRDTTEAGIDLQRDQDEIGRDTQAEQEEARLERQRNDEDAFIESQQDKIDARQEARDDVQDERETARQDEADAKEEARQDLADAHLENQQDNADARQEARDDEEDARQEARDDEEDAREEARQDTADAHLEAQHATEDAHLEAQQEREDARQEARDDEEDARQEARDDEEDARQEARDDEEDARQEARDDEEDARQEAKDDEEDARQEARDDEEDARQEARDDEEDARQEARDDEEDARQEARDDEEDARQEARDDEEDAREEARQDTADAHLEAQQEREDARQEARDDEEDAREEARQDTADAHLEAQHAAEDAHLEAQQEREDAHLENQQNIADARQEARDDEEDARQEARDDEADAKEDARQALADAKLEEREALADAKLEEREALQTTNTEAREVLQDTGLEEREDLQTTNTEAREQLQDAHQQVRFNMDNAHLEMMHSLIDAHQEDLQDYQDLRLADRQDLIDARTNERLDLIDERTINLYDTLINNLGSALANIPLAPLQGGQLPGAPTTGGAGGQLPIQPSIADQARAATLAAAEARRLGLTGEDIHTFVANSLTRFLRQVLAENNRNNPSNQGQTINLTIENLIKLSETETVRAITNRQIQLDQQGVAPQ